MLCTHYVRDKLADETPQGGHPLLMLLLAGGGENANASQFYITTGTELDSLDGKHTIFGEVSEGLDVLENINNAFVDKGNRPLQNIRWVLHTSWWSHAVTLNIAAMEKATGRCRYEFCA